jgi:pyrimidine-nucleoside phosphorylase
MNPVETIRKKREGMKLSHQEIENFFNGYMTGTVADYHMSAFLMAVYFQKMDFEETAILTELMLQSGKSADLSCIRSTKIGKHSTGGVGDKISLIIAPMVAACGVCVPMVSGRALGHTGGTLDKLESIPGFRTDFSLNEYGRILSDVGAVMIGQTEELAPVDRKLYALRDVTSTVESIPLIAASIMSKKLAEGIDGLVLDVKTGNGAFLRSEEDAAELAITLIKVGEKFGLKSIAFLTDMNQPLGHAVGSWLEVKECIDCLQGKNVEDVMEVSYVLGGAMVHLGGKAGSINEGILLCRDAIRSGKAWEKFIDIVGRQGGNKKYLFNPEIYGSAACSKEVLSTTAGDIDEIDTREVGMVGVMLGCGRVKLNDQIQHRAGIIIRKKVSDSVQVGEPLAILYSERSDVLEEAGRRIGAAFRIATEPSVSSPLIHAMVDDSGVHPWKAFS